MWLIADHPRCSRNPAGAQVAAEIADGGFPRNGANLNNSKPI
jgi:hypothetical protein